MLEPACCRPSALRHAPVRCRCEQVSGNTGRLHLHLSADGSRPLGVNAPLETLAAPRMLRALCDRVRAGHAALAPAPPPPLPPADAAVAAAAVAAPALPPRHVQEQLAGLLAALQLADAPAGGGEITAGPAGPGAAAQDPEQRPEASPLVATPSGAAAASAAAAAAVDARASATRRMVSLVASVTPGFFGPSGLVAVAPACTLAAEPSPMRTPSLGAGAPSQRLPGTQGAGVGGSQPARAALGGGEARAQVEEGAAMEQEEEPGSLQCVAATPLEGEAAAAAAREAPGDAGAAAARGVAAGGEPEEGGGGEEGAAARLRWRVLGAEQVVELLMEASRFARDWRELRAVTKSRLQNRVLTSSLQVRAHAPAAALRCSRLVACVSERVPRNTAVRPLTPCASP